MPFLAAAVLLCVLAPSAAATAPGKNGKIAFWHQESEQPRAMHVINPDGSGEQVVSGGFFAEDGPAWSPDGRELAFRCWESESGGDSICKAKADGSDGELVASECCGNFGPTWGPTGAHLMWTVTGARFVPPYLWRVDADGTDPIRLRVGASPDWSPESPGSRVAYVDQGAGGHNQIYVMSADNSTSDPLTETATAENLHPSWSPDGTIAFASQRDGNSEIYIADAHGIVQTRLTNNPAYDTEPDVSPDGTKIVFSSDRDGELDLYVMNIDGTGVTQLTDDPDSANLSADWQALPEGYARPKGATPLRVSLVPAFDPCAAPNRSHGPPLAFGSCAPPTTPSRYATVGPRSIGHVRLEVSPQPSPGGSDVRVSATLTDVKRISDLADALAPLDLTLAAQITDDATGGLRLSNGTTVRPGYVENPLHVDLPCQPTADPATGSTCSVQTSLAALSGLSGERAVVELDKVTVYDAGEEGSVDDRFDNTPLAVQGVFVP